MKLVTPEQMREMDRRTIEHVGVPGVILMEHAALGAAEKLLEHYEPPPNARIGIVCGGGNNGGDGYAMARLLRHRNFRVELIALKAIDALRGDAAVNAQAAKNLDILIHDLSDVEDLDTALSQIEPCFLWCDAIFGTGLDRPVTGRYASAITFLRKQHHVFAVDIPSGLDASTGQVLGTCVTADACATFAFPKLGQVLDPGRIHNGVLYTVDIGIPPEVVETVGTTADWLTHEWSKDKLGARPLDAHKGVAGKVFTIAGSPQMKGAALLSARATIESGAGLVTVGTHEDIATSIATSIPEIMACAVTGKQTTPEHQQNLQTQLTRAGVLVVGPGLGQNEPVQRLLEQSFSASKTMVLDADALNLIAASDNLREQLKTHPMTCILTPHPGEMARLCKTSIAEIAANPVHYARTLALKLNSTIVLKLATTIICDASGTLAVNSSGNAGMASAGMGDVLTGIIAARVAEAQILGKDVFEAVCLAVYLHGAAGDRARQCYGMRGITASRVLEQLSSFWSDLE